MFWEKIRKFKKDLFRHTPLVEVILHKKNLLHNLRVFKEKYPFLSFAPVLKSNAYGHGLLDTARILDREGSPFFVVDSFFEARTLRRGGIKTPILAIGYSLSENIVRSNLKNISFAITSISHLKEISEAIKKEKIFHIKIDTGMRRQGVLEEEIDEAIDIIKSNKLIKIEGICTHLSDSENVDTAFSKKQFEVWGRAVEKIKNAFPEIKYFHVFNTGGTYFSGSTFSNVARIGIGLYGINTSLADLDLRPTLEVKTKIVAIKKIKAGDSVGYNMTFTADKDMRIGILPLGFFEGLDRRLSNIGFVKVGENFAKIVGRVSMNITGIDLSDIKGVSVGDEVVVISPHKEDKNSILNMSKIGGASSYELLVHIPEQLYRRVAD